MPWLVLGIALVIGLVLVLRGVSGLDPRRAARFIFWIVVLLVGSGAAFLVVQGGPGFVLMALGLLLPALMRWRATRRFFRNFGGPSPGQSTGVETRFLRMSLDHDTGILDGMVLQGQYRGRRLSELDSAGLSDLLRECRVEDEESATVLEAYLDRTYGPSWRGGEEAASGAEGGTRGGRGPAPGGGRMTREEACEVLGVRKGASAAEIKKAHHELMKKYHPDQGGSNYLATKINAAKDVLLGD